jgi:hypothetical protein
VGPGVTAPIRRCLQCGQVPRGLVTVSLHGEWTCASHPVAGTCVFCARPHPAPAPPGWRPFSEHTLRCPTCLAGAVETQVDARRWLPSVRHEMAGLGIELAERVRVRIVDPATVPAAGPDPAGRRLLLGLTDLWIGPTVRVGGIRIVAGQPPTHFGRAVAHEIGHAWLAQRGSVRPEHAVEEGVCELFAHAWLKKQRTPLAEHLRENLRTNPDPVYGGGFRRVHEAVVGRGIAAVLDAVLRTGRL